MSPVTTARFWLAPFSGEPEGRCPMCLSQTVMTEFHDTVVVGMCKERRDGILAMTETPWEIPDECTAHLCRGCESCGYEWSEHVAGPEDLRKARGGIDDE